MDSFLENVGILAIFIAVIYGYKKLLEYQNLKRPYLREDDTVYEAARKFACGVSPDDIKPILAGCSGLNEQFAERALSRALPHRNDKDGGYRAFIRSVNMVLGEDVYSTRRRK